MSETKELVVQLLQSLPENATLEQISDEVAMLAAIQRGLAAADRGEVVSHEEVKKRIESWRSK